MSGNGKETIIITGASSGIGREVALQLAAPGRILWLIGRNREKLEETAAAAKEKGATAFFECLDLADLPASGDFLNSTFPLKQPVDAIYLAAAVSLFGEVKDMLPDDWDRLYQTNLLSPLQWTRHFYEGMVGRKAGRIVIVSSLSAYTGYPTACAYATMKAGLIGLFRSLWHEAQAHGVSLHLASPGYVNTQIYQRATFRGTNYKKTMGEIQKLGFPILSAAETASKIIRATDLGTSEFAIPVYASILKWLAPRFPWLITLIHKRIVNRFRRTP